MLKELKLMLGIASDDTSIDEKLMLILSTVTARLKVLLGGNEPPFNMQHIILEVAIIRFNRIGSEGVTIHNVEGESLHFADSDFAGFMDEIQAYLDTQKDSVRGRVRFL